MLALVVLATVLVTPLLLNAYQSFFAVNPFEQQYDLVWFQNYAALLVDQSFVRSARVTVLYATASASLTAGGALLLSLVIGNRLTVLRLAPFLVIPHYCLLSRAPQSFPCCSTASWGY